MYEGYKPLVLMYETLVNDMFCNGAGTPVMKVWEIRLDFGT